MERVFVDSLQEQIQTELPSNSTTITVTTVNAQRFSNALAGGNRYIELSLAQFDTAHQVWTAVELVNATSIDGNTVTVTRPTNAISFEAGYFLFAGLSADDFANILAIVVIASNVEQIVTAVQADSTQAKSDAATAISTANTAATAATTAVTTANTAATAATTAVTTANAAATDASDAVTTANAAATAASDAVTTANAAATAATDAVTTANAAATDATDAITTANAAQTAASTAVSTANSASTDASDAVTTANAASANASDAVTTANAASANASDAVTTANAAETDAATAISTANGAVTTANDAYDVASGIAATANTALLNSENAIEIAETALSTVVSDVPFHHSINFPSSAVQASSVQGTPAWNATLTAIKATISTVSTTDLTFEGLKNGVSIGTVTITAGDKIATASLSVTALTTDFFGASITASGGDATGAILTFIFRRT